MYNTVTYYILLYAVAITYTMYQLISKLYVINIKILFSKYSTYNFSSISYQTLNNIFITVDFKIFFFFRNSLKNLITIKVSIY